MASKWSILVKRKWVHFVILTEERARNRNERRIVCREQRKRKERREKNELTVFASTVPWDSYRTSITTSHFIFGRYFLLLGTSLAFDLKDEPQWCSPFFLAGSAGVRKPLGYLCVEHQTQQEVPVAVVRVLVRFVRRDCFSETLIRYFKSLIVNVLFTGRFAILLTFRFPMGIVTGTCGGVLWRLGRLFHIVPPPTRLAGSFQEMEELSFRRIERMLVLVMISASKIFIISIFTSSQTNQGRTKIDQTVQLTCNTTSEDAPASSYQ